MIILAIDIGNTRTTLGVFKGKKLAGTVHFPSTISPSKVRQQIQRVLQQIRVSPDALSGVVISSVVPSLTKKLSAAIKRLVHIKPLVVTGTLNIGLRILYKNPKSLGADRICSAVAAFHTYGGPIIIVDAGTATTYDVLSKDGTFLGGAIAPGIMTTAAALHLRTAQLPKIQLHFPKNIIGKTTAENIQSGILYGAIDAMEGMIRRIKAVTGKRTRVILTGGFSNILRKRTRMIDIVEPSLVLEGARLICERVRRASK